MIDRNTPPSIGEIKKVPFIEPVKFALDNGWEVWLLDSGTEEVVQVEFSFHAGSRFQEKTFQARIANKMLREGTKNHSSEALNEAIDYYGAFLQLDSDRDLSSIVLYSLNKHLDNVLPLMGEVVSGSIFPQRELDIVLRNSRQSFLVNEEKVGSVAHRRFGSLLFGEQHPYGRYGNADDFAALNVDDLKSFRDRAYAPANSIIVVSGKLPADILKSLNAVFGQMEMGKALVGDDFPSPNPTQELFHLVEKEAAIQSAVMVGRSLFTKTHPDFCAMQVLNTVFGGYFGSRLMSNIREDKGYTYGIGSGVNAMHQDGFFSISTEVGVDVAKATLTEIHHELDRLRTDLIPEKELDLVRNYLLGSFLRSTDGPFAQSDRFLGIYYHGLGYDFYERFIQTVKEVDASTLRDLAQKYLRKEDLIQLVVGKYE